MTTAAIDQNHRTERTELERHLMDDIKKNTPLWPDIHGVVEAFERLMGPRHRDAIREIVNGERGRHLQRRKLGKKIHYNAKQLPSIITAYFYEESEPLAWGFKADPSNGSAHYSVKAKAKAAEV